MRLHPYLTERMLASSPALSALGAIAGQHHERLDGSGYPRGLTGNAIAPEGRILAAALVAGDDFEAQRADLAERAAAISERYPLYASLAAAALA